MWLCCVDLVIVIPYHSYIIASSLINTPLYPWVSWEVTQADWYRVDFYRRFIIDLSPYLRFELLAVLFMQSLISCVFLLLFGFTRETTKGYKDAFYWCMKPFGVKRPQRTTTAAGPKRHKRSWLDKLLGRDVIPLNSVMDTTGSLPTFASHVQSSKENRSIPSARPKQSPTNSATDTLNWEDDLTDGHASVIVIDGRRLTIPGLNAMASFDSEDIYGEKPHKIAPPPGISQDKDSHSHSPV